MATHKRLRNMTAGSANNASGSYSQDCSICLNSIAVKPSNPSSATLQGANCCPSLVSACSWLRAHTRGTTSASGPSSLPPPTPSSSAPTAAPPPISRRKSRTQRSGSSWTRTRAAEPHKKARSSRTPRARPIQTPPPTPPRHCGGQETRPLPPGNNQHNNQRHHNNHNHSYPKPSSPT